MKKMKIYFFCITAIFFIIYSCKKDENSNEKDVIDDAIPKNGLVAYYTFAKGNASDLSGENNNGIISGALSTSDRFLRRNESFQFTYEDDFINVNNPSFVDNTQGTFLAWVKFSNLNHTQYVASVGDTHSIENYLSFIRLDPTSYTLGIYQREPGLANWVNGTTVISPNVYYHVAMLSDGVTWSIYINGQKEELIVKNGSNSGKWIGNLLSIDNFVIGSSIIAKPYTVPYLSGIIDEVLLYNRPLSEEEIKQIYQLGL